SSAACRASRGSGGLLESTTRSGSHACLNLFPLGLQYCRSKKRHLLALLYTTQNLGVVEIAYSDADDSRRVRVALLDEHEQHASPAGATCTPTRGAAASAAPSGSATAATAPEASARRGRLA